MHGNILAVRVDAAKRLISIANLMEAAQRGVQAVLAEKRSKLPIFTGPVDLDGLKLYSKTGTLQANLGMRGGVDLHLRNLARGGHVKAKVFIQTAKGLARQSKASKETLARIIGRMIKDLKYQITHIDPRDPLTILRRKHG